MAVLEDTDARGRVLAAADAAFYAQGFRAVGMDDLRAASGVSLKRIYALFPSKDVLAAEVLERRHAMWTADIHRAVDAVADPRERPLAIYDFLADWFRTDTFRGCAFVNAFAEIGAQSPRVAELARLHKLRFQSYVAELVAAAGLPTDLGPQLALLAEGAQAHAALTGDVAAAPNARAAAQRLVRAALAEADAVASATQAVPGARP